MKILDANIILRCILNDEETLALKAKSILENNICFAPNEVIAEVVFVLQKVYEVPRELICNLISLSLNYYQVQNEMLLKTALNYFSETTLDFVDCLLASYNTVGKNEIFTFDKKLNNFIKRLNKN